MAIFEHFFKLFCNLFFFFKILKRLFFRLFDPFSTTKRLKTDSRFDYLTVLKTTKAPEASPVSNSLSISLSKSALSRRYLTTLLVQCPIHCQFHSQNQLFQDDISRLSFSNSTKIFKGAEYNLSIYAYKFCSPRSLRCRPA